MGLVNRAATTEDISMIMEERSCLSAKYFLEKQAMGQGSRGEDPSPPRPSLTPSLSLLKRLMLKITSGELGSGGPHPIACFSRNFLSIV